MVKILLYETKIAVAFGMDLIFGDPKFIPHTVTGIGKLVSFLEKKSGSLVKTSASFSQQW